MIKINTLIILIYFCFLNQSFSQEAPQDLTVIEQDLSTFQESPEKNQQVNQESNSNFYFPAQKKIKQSEGDKYNEITIDDIPQEFNDWYGLLASEEGGLGWLMWGSTDYKYALNLVKNSDFLINSPNLLSLYENILLSRAKSPNKNITVNKLEGDYLTKKAVNDQSLSFFYEKVRIFTRLGLNRNIKSLSDSIPLELKKESFTP